MPGATLPGDETARLLDLARYRILDTSPEATLDRLTRLAAQALRTPVAGINFIEAHRQWNKSRFGSSDPTGPRLESICAWAILGTQPLQVEDISADPRFAHHAPPVPAPGPRMYVGVPLITPQGHAIGTLYVTDSRPRRLNDTELSMLQDFAALVMEVLEARVQRAELEQAAKGAHQAARQDPLTGLLNRRAFDEDLAATAIQPLFTLAVVDIDGLKAVNDTTGHASGDQVIQTFAQALALFLHPLGRVYRIGGDEFAMILEPLPAEQVRAAVQEAADRTRRNSSRQMGASVGVASSSEGQEVRGILHLADQRMYAAKRERRL